MITTKPLLFIHIPKTAGISVIEALPEVREFSHLLTPEVYQIMPNWREHYRFTVVRHPADRLLSAYSYIFQMTPDNPWYANDTDERNYLNNWVDFEDFVLNFTDLNYQHLQPQRRWLYYLDRIYRYEALGELERELGCTLPRRNASKHDHWQKAYTAEMLKRVRHLYAEDFDLGFWG